jgi:hypothetical protein
MAQDYRNSIAQIDIDYLTEIQVTTNPGANYMRTAIFIDKNDEYILDKSILKDVIVDTKTGIQDQFAVLTKNSYQTVTGGRLKFWLTNLFESGNPFEVLVFTFGPAGGFTNAATFDKPKQEELTNLLNRVKGTAYHKAILVQNSTDDTPIWQIESFFADICKEDKLLNDAPRFRLNPSNPAKPGSLDPADDPLYADLKKKGTNAYFVYHADNEKNPALFYLGQCLSGANASGTPVGDNGGATNAITPSGQPDPDTPNFTPNEWEDYNLEYGDIQAFNSANIGFYQTVGNGTGYVCGRGGIDRGIMNNVFQADWIVNFCNFCNKVKAAEMTSRKNFLRNSTSYGNILSMTMATMRPFVDSGRLENLLSTAPSFDRLPPSGGKEIIIPGAWEAYYVDTITKIRVYGTLNIAM